MSRVEQTIQKAIFEHLAWRGAPDIFAWHPFSGGKRSPVEAAIYRGLGAVAGVPDVFILREKLFCLELKTESGKATKTQLETISRLERAGAVTGVAHGLDEALAWLEHHGLLRGVTQ